MIFFKKWYWFWLPTGIYSNLNFFILSFIEFLIFFWQLFILPKYQCPVQLQHTNGVSINIFVIYRPRKTYERIWLFSKLENITSWRLALLGLSMHFSFLSLKISNILPWKYPKTAIVNLDFGMWLRVINFKQLTKVIRASSSVVSLRGLQRKKCPYSELLCSVFSQIRTEYGEMLCISLYSSQMWENTDQNNSECWHVSRSGLFHLWPRSLFCHCSFKI